MPDTIYARGDERGPECNDGNIGFGDIVEDDWAPVVASGVYVNHVGVLIEVE